jgi:Calcineurin-like phosphoesterase
MLFLGNYVDHGDHQLHVICLLLLLMVRYPSSYFLLRGKHESSEINGLKCCRTFAKACEKCVGPGKPGDWEYVWNLFNDVFMLLPVEAVVDGKYYCASEGLSTGLPASKAQALEDSNDVGIVQVRYFDAVIVGLCEVTHVQSDSLMVDPEERVP